MTAVDDIITATFALYLLLMIGIGVVAYRRTRDLADYILGGRRLGSWVSALSAGASDMSGWLLLGLPGYAYVAGLEAGWIALGLLAGTWLNWRVVAARLRVWSERAGNALTLPEFLERRFDDRTRLLRIIAAVFILLFFTFYTSSGLVAGGRLFNAVFGLPYTWAVTAGALTILIYTFLGGFFAVCWTDLIQGLLMAFALVLVPLLGFAAAGGGEATTATIAAVNVELLNPLTTAGGEGLGAVAILSLLGWGLGYFGQPHILARFMAIRSPARVPRARRIAVTWTAVSLTGALAAGLTGIALVQPALQGPDTEKVFIELIGALLHPVPAGICLAAILAAIMSTADSQLLVASSALTEDLYKGFVRRTAGPSELVWTGRLAVVTIAVGAYALALDENARVLDLVAYAWAGFGAAFGPALILSLFWRRVTAYGVMAGMLAGGLTVLVWKPLAGGWFDLYEIVPGFALATVAVVIVSLLGSSVSAPGNNAENAKAQRR